MDWPLIGFTAFSSWFALLVASDVGSLLKLSQRRQAFAHNVAFAASLAAVFALGFVLAGEHRPVPCSVGVHPR